MNVELLRRVADAVEKEEIARFDMHKWVETEDGQGRDCGTSACVAGFACLLEYGNPRDALRAALENQDKVILGLTKGEANHLFYGDRFRTSGINRIHRKEPGVIPDALRWMADHETIDWGAGIAAAREKAECAARREEMGSA